MSKPVENFAISHMCSFGVLSRSGILFSTNLLGRKYRTQDCNQSKASFEQHYRVVERYLCELIKFDYVREEKGYEVKCAD